MGHNEPIRRNPHGTSSTARASELRGNGEIPDKLYFRIGDVARICEVPAYVLRFWETEFPQLRPNKGGTGQRLYRRREVELALRIKCLLRDEGYTIPGARQLLKSELKQKEPQLSLIATEGPDLRKLSGLRRELESIVAMLSQPPGTRLGPLALRSPRRSSAKPTASQPQRSHRGEGLFDSSSGPLETS